MNKTSLPRLRTPLWLSLLVILSLSALGLAGARHSQAKDGPMTTATQGEVYGQARVLAPSLNLRTGPHVSYTAVAYLMEGEVVNLVGRNRTSTWVQIHLYNGYRGWVNAAYVQPGIAIDALPIVDVSLLGITAFVTNDPIPVYTGPGTTYQLIDSARPGDVLALNGRDAAATWVHVYLPDGRGGWAAAGSSFLPSASLNDLPILTPFLDAPPPDLAPFFLVYDGPGFLYEPVDNVSQGQTLAILARSDDSRWIKIQLSNGRAGWIAAEIVQIDAALANVPVIEGVAPPQVVGWQASSQTRDANGSSATPSGGKPALATPTATPEPTQPLEATKPAKPSITPSPTIAPTQTSTTVATATPTSTPQATSTTAAPTGTAEATPEEGSAPPPGIPIVYVYTTPDETAEVLLRIVPGQSVVLVGRTADEKWIKIWLPGDQEGWVKADVLQLDIDVAVLPVVDP